MASEHPSEESKDEARPLEYCLRKYLLLLAIMVATVTYAAGFNPPGGVWQDTEAGHLAGDSILRETYYPRYLIFFYCNAAAFAMSIVVIILIFILAIVHEKKKLWVPMLPLRVAMVLDLLGLVGAYAAGTSRNVLKAGNASVLVATLAYMVVQVVLTSFPGILEKFRCTGKGKKEEAKEQLHPADGNETNNQQSQPGDEKEEEKERRRKLMLLLATFVMSITYLAGLSAPGGYWDNRNDGHNAGDPVMLEHHEIRLKAFFAFNAIAFVMSLLIIMLLLDKQLVIPLLHGNDQRTKTPVRTFVLKAYIFIALVGLAGAYVTGSSRESDTTIYVCSLVLVVLACIIVLRKIISCQSDSNARSNIVGGGEQPHTSNCGAETNASNGVGQTNTSNGGKETSTSNGGAEISTSNGGAETSTSNGGARLNTSNGGAHLDTNNGGAETSTSNGGAHPNTNNGGAETNTSNGEAQPNPSKTNFLEQAQSLVVLLSTLVATVTYQAGLVPPGGVWQDNWNGHEAGKPILLSMKPERYKVFFYCNSIAFAASLVIIILVQYKPFLRRHLLQFAMIMDLFGLIGAYSAGSCRDVTTSIYVIALAGAVLVYVVIHVVFATLEDEKDLNPEDKKLVDKRRKRLLLFAVLCVTLTYQAGLTPPGGFRLKDDEFGHHAGDPVLFYNYPRRYKAFFYCNSVSFMSSIALIILLVNPNMYRPAIRSYALSVCTGVGMFALMCAYAAGSTQHLKTSIYIFGLVALVLFIMILVLIYFYCREKGILSCKKGDVENGNSPAKQDVTKQDAKTLKPTETKSDVQMEEDGITVKSTDLNEDASTAMSFKVGETGESNQNTSKKSKQEGTVTDSGQTEDKSKKKHATRKYLMLLGVLAASVTYQAGLNPPGGVWQGDSNGHAAGDPVMHDNQRHRYLIFFYSNSTSFMASIVVIILLLPEKLLKDKWPLNVMNIMIVLDLLGLLLAYMAGSSMRLECSGYFIVFVIVALGIAAIHKTWLLREKCKKNEGKMVSID
uniref:PGG domain-containing protein n=1 Tax=Leersia perrieri TaxID=77586 RepID=A0A0D9WPG2_9ORYZ